jgi:iron-sulfur cluster assembly accessory protein
VESPSDPELFFKLHLAPSAINRIKTLNKKDPAKYKYLRIFVEGGGCAGFQYAFDVVADKNDEIEFEHDGVKILSDEMTLDMISGSSIEYKSEMIRSSFEVVDNPMAEGGCSCGTSFTPKGM